MNNANQPPSSTAGQENTQQLPDPWAAPAPAAGRQTNPLLGMRMFYHFCFVYFNISATTAGGANANPFSSMLANPEMLQQAMRDMSNNPALMNMVCLMISIN